MPGDGRGDPENGGKGAAGFVLPRPQAANAKPLLVFPFRETKSSHRLNRTVPCRNKTPHEYFQENPLSHMAPFVLLNLSHGFLRRPSLRFILFFKK